MDPVQARQFRTQLVGLRRRLRAEHAEELSWTSVAVLGAIDRLGDQATVSAVGAETDMRRPNVTTAVQRLETDGFVRRDEHPTDRRSHLLRVTPAGRRVLQRDRQRREQWLVTAAHEVLSEQEIAVLLRAGDLMERLTTWKATS